MKLSDFYGQVSVASEDLPFLEMLNKSHVFNTKAKQEDLHASKLLQSKEDSSLEAIARILSQTWQLVDARNSPYVDVNNIYPEISIFIWERKEFSPVFPRIVEGYPNIVPRAVSIIDPDGIRRDEICRVEYEPQFLNWTNYRDIWHRGLTLIPERFGEKGRILVLDLLKQPYDIARLVNYFQQFYG